MEDAMVTMGIPAKRKYLVGSFHDFRALWKQFGEERRSVHLQNKV
jgi:hypothetical protein